MGLISQRVFDGGCHVLGSVFMHKKASFFYLLLLLIDHIVSPSSFVNLFFHFFILLNTGLFQKLLCLLRYFCHLTILSFCVFSFPLYRVYFIIGTELIHVWYWFYFILLIWFDLLGYFMVTYNPLCHGGENMTSDFLLGNFDRLVASLHLFRGFH